MIKVDKATIDLEGTAPLVLTELGVAACEIIIGMMEYDGRTKEKAIEMVYKALEVSIKSYEHESKL